MGAANESLANDSEQGGVDRLFFLKVERRRSPFLAAMDGEKVVGSTEFAAGLADQEDLVTSLLEGLGGDVRRVVDAADHGDGGGRVDRTGGAFVVEADIAAGDGDVEGAASLGDSLHGGAELVEVLRLVGVAEVEVVGDTERNGSRAGQVAGALGDGDARTDRGIEAAVDGVAIGGGGEDLVRLADNEDGRVGSREDRRPRADHVVVLTPDPALAGNTGMGKELGQDRGRIGLRDAREVERCGLSEGSRLAEIERAVIGKRAGGNFDHDILTVADTHHAVVRDGADLRVGKVPLLEDPLHDILLTLLDDHEHALLRLAEENLIGGLALRALRHKLDVDLDTGAATTGSLAGGAGESGRAHVLDTGDRVGGEEFETGLEQELLAERITHLDGGTVGLRFLGQLARGESGTGKSVAPGLGADVEDGIPHTLGGAAGDLLVAEDAEAEGVHQRVAAVALVEVDLAGDGGKTDAVAIVGDAGDHAREEAAVGPGLLRVPLDGAEAEGIHEEDRTRSHGEDVADDAADTGGRPLEGLDRAWVVMTLDLEGHGPAVADVDDACILLARLDQNTRAGGRELAELGTGILVGAVLAPHDGEDAEFLEARLATEDRKDLLVLFRGESVLGDEFGSDRGIGHG